jgi:radical SAM/Cys-rich protein
MDRKTAEMVLYKLIQIRPEIVEFTGGAPEMNENLIYFIKGLSEEDIRIVVRTNLTVLDHPEYSHFIDIYKRYNIKLVASLPSYIEEMTDSQRGKGVFKRSIKVLKKLCDLGYGRDGLELDLVHNPVGSFISESSSLEGAYRKALKDDHGITFNNLITITNVPIGGFKRYLLSSNQYDNYMQLLVNNFNFKTIDRLMCKSLLSIDYEGFVYDCDFNLAINKKIKGYEDKRFWDIDFSDFNPIISCGEHCYACTALTGSSCNGSLIKNDDLDIRNAVRNYYGKEVKKSSDLKTGACCNLDLISPQIKEVLEIIDPEIKERYYGCGSPIPFAIKGLKVLDIGCGTGLDCYILSKLVGSNGHVYGIDMTEEQIYIAKRHILPHTERFGYREPNLTFIHDYIENLSKYFKEESLDIVISNCVVNLIEDKEGVIRQVYRILKDGGEFYFSDIYSDRRLPKDVRKNPVLYGECLGGALYWKDFERIARKAGFLDPRVVSKRVVKIDNEEIKELVGNVIFYSITYRLWKLEGLEDACEDYGHIAIYKGGMEGSPFKYALDEAHIFEKDKPERVCGNTALMLSKTRLKDFFLIIGDFEKHFGLFKGCGTSILAKEDNEGSDGSSCC